MKKLIYFIAFILLASCKNELVKKPVKLIDRETMVGIIYDISILDAMKENNPVYIDSFKNNTNNYIFKKHKVDSLSFSQSNAYYAADYNEYEKMYNDVKSRLEKEKAEVSLLLKAKAKKELLKQKLKKKKIADSIQKAKKNLKVKLKNDSIKKVTQ